MVVRVVVRVVLRFLSDFFYQHIIPDPIPSTDWPTWDINSVNSKGFRLKVLTLNLWGLPVAPKCAERITQVAQSLNGDYDIICFQEVWHRREKNILISYAQRYGYKYFHYFQASTGFPVPLGSTAFGTGLLIVSKYPIVDTLYYRYNLSGKPYALHEADFIASKGVGLLHIQTPVGVIDLYVSHLLANYNYLGAPGPGDRYLPQRTAQSYELARFINTTSKSSLVIVCGDFNSPADCICLRIPRTLSSLRDAFRDCSNEEGLTFGTKDNCYSHGEHPMRMDYVLYRITNDQSIKPSQIPSNIATQSANWHLVNSQVVKQFYKDSTGAVLPVSDHFGVNAEFCFGVNCSHESNNFKGHQPYGQESYEYEVHRKASDLCDLHKSFRSASIDLESDQLHSNPMGCLKETLRLSQIGTERSMECRQGHLRRSIIGLILFLFLLICSSQLGWTKFYHFMTPFLFVYILLEYTLAYYAATIECTSFIELTSQLKLQIHALEAKEAMM